MHCFSNGNGRHSRLAADVVIERLFGGEIFTRSSQNLIYKGEPRAAYLTAVRAADKGDYDLLLAFAHS
ncbi:hypothetical protein [Spirosoma foliorum]|uniref:hypothetical protein n=1 Tax=Spirosoma foliorum TaxID=2710596 RepID=UPI0035AC15E9